MVGKRERKRPFGGPRRRLQDNIEINLQEIGWSLNWTELAHDRGRWQALEGEANYSRIQ